MTYSIRTLAVFVSVFICNVAVFCFFARNANLQKETREQIKQIGGLAVFYVSESSDPTSYFFVEDDHGYISNLMTDCFGVDSTSNVILIDLSRATKVPLSLRTKIRALTDVRAIFLDGDRNNIELWKSEFPHVVLLEFSSQKKYIPKHLTENQQAYWSEAYSSFAIESETEKGGMSE